MERSAPLPVTLYPKRSSTILLALGSAAFVALSIWLISRGETFGYLCAGFFGLCFAVAIVQLLPGSSSLKLDESGFTFTSLSRATFVRWTDVEEFVVVSITTSGATNRMVGFNFVPTYDRSQLGRALSRAFANTDAALPDSYGKSTEELAALMNERLAIAKRIAAGPKPAPGAASGGS